MGQQEQLFAREEFRFSLGLLGNDMNLNCSSEDFHSAGPQRVSFITSRVNMSPRVLNSFYVPAVSFFISAKMGKSFSLKPCWKKHASFARMVCLYVLVCVVVFQNENFEGEHRRRRTRWTGTAFWTSKNFLCEPFERDMEEIHIFRFGRMSLHIFQDETPTACNFQDGETSRCGPDFSTRKDDSQRTKLGGIQENGSELTCTAQKHLELENFDFDAHIMITIL